MRSSRSKGETVRIVEDDGIGRRHLTRRPPIRSVNAGIMSLLRRFCPRPHARTLMRIRHNADGRSCPIVSFSPRDAGRRPCNRTVAEVSCNCRSEVMMARQPYRECETVHRGEPQFRIGFREHRAAF